MIDQVKEALESMQSNVTEAVNGLDDALTKVEDRVGVLEARVRELESLLNDQRRSWMSRDHRKIEPAAAEPTPAEPAAEAVPVKVAQPDSRPFGTCFEAINADEPEAAQPKQRKPRAPNGSHKLVAETVLDAANKGSLTSPFSRSMAVDVALPKHSDVTPQIVSKALQELVEAGLLKMSGERAQARYSLP